MLNKIKSLFQKNEKEMKEPQEQKLTVHDELRQAKEELNRIWKKVLPLSSDKVYSLDEKTRSVLISSEIENYTEEKVLNTMVSSEFSNPFNLNEKQHEALVVALSVMNTLVDEMIVGFISPRPGKYPSTWKAPQEHADVAYVRCNYHYINQEDWDVMYHDVPVHFENHARIMGKRTPSQQYEEIIEHIPAGEERCRSILEKLVKPFIHSFDRVAVLSSFMQKFCNKLIPTDNFSCCIDARTRQAFDFALSCDIAVPTFSELLNDAMELCPEDKQDNYFYILAYLMQQHWGKKYKKDIGTNGLCKEDGILTSDSHQLLLEGILSTVLEINCTNDFLYAYDIVPKKFRLDYIGLITRQSNFFKSLYLDEYEKNRYSKIITEMHDGISTLNFILTHCDADVARRCLNCIEAPYLEALAIEDIWQNKSIYTLVDFNILNPDYLKIFLQKIAASQLQELVKIQRYNPFENMLDFCTVLKFLRGKLEPKDISKLFIDANIKHYVVLSHIKNFDALREVIPASLFLDVCLSKKLLPGLFGNNRSVVISRTVNLIIDAASENGTIQESVLEHLMQEINYGETVIHTNFIGYFILRDNDKLDYPQYMSILSKIPSVILMRLFQNLGFKYFTISLTFLKEIIDVLPEADIDTILAMNFKISGKIENASCLKTIDYLSSHLTPNRMTLLLKHFSAEKIKQIVEDKKLYLNSVLEWLEQGHSHDFDFLIKLKPSLKISMDDGLTPLMIAVQTGHLKGIKLLLEDNNTASVNAQESKLGWTALHYAVKNKNPELLKLFLETSVEKHSIDINACDKQGVTPLILAAEQGDLESVKLLLSIGKANPHSNIPLHTAIIKGYLKIVNQLLEAGADPNVLIYSKGNVPERPEGCTLIDNDPTTVLEIAAENADLNIIKTLLNHHAKPFNKAPSHPNVSAAYVKCCALAFATNNIKEFMGKFQHFKKMDTKIDQLLKKSQYCNNSKKVIELYAIYDDYMNQVDFSIINDKLVIIEENLNKEPIKSEGVRCRKPGPVVLFVGDESKQEMPNLRASERAVGKRLRQEIRGNLTIISSFQHSFFRFDGEGIIILAEHGVVTVHGKRI